MGPDEMFGVMLLICSACSLIHPLAGCSFKDDNASETNRVLPKISISVRQFSHLKDCCAEDGSGYQTRVIPKSNMEIAITNCDNKIRVEERWREVEVVNGITVGQLRSFLQVIRLIYSFVTVDACFVLFILQHNRSKLLPHTILLLRIFNGYKREWYEELSKGIGDVNALIIIVFSDDGASIQASRSVLGINAQFKYVSLQWHNFGELNICGWVQKVVCFKEHLIRDVFKPFYQPKAGTYMKLIVLLGRSGQPQHARNLFNMMIEEGLEPTAELYTTLLAAYCLVDSPYQHCEDDNHSFINAFGNMADTTSAGTEHYYTRSRIQY
ncbi:Pentatricopeptide repeat-containing protein [Artemisia annua]|uniref:Pentatricopeptide repeat-containing protein n=1 Tax=Artemisia annua TaxID=35608 RepID=A0A2U1Q3S8_ARTAN|nr:Pentatricopeptide repeat-containing protein [Artemisia annua]